MTLTQKVMNLKSIHRRGLVDNELQAISDALGVEILRKYLYKDNNFEVSLRLSQLPSPYGLSVLIADDYLSWRIQVSLDHFSRRMLDFMKESYFDRQAGLVSLFDLASIRNNRFQFKINGLDREEVNESIIWEDFSLTIAKSYYSEELEFSALRSVLLDFFSILLFMMLKETEWGNLDEVSEEGEFEGDKLRIEVNRYERSRYNRAICLSYFGFQCRGCGITLEQKYGPLGSNVIHVHHVVPVSQMGGSYRLDPIRDLVPLCPNCHNIVHRVNPPLLLQNLQEMTGFTTE